MRTGKVKAPAPVIRRLSNYHHILLGMRERRIQRVSSTTLAEILEYKPIQVRKDLQLTGLVGKPRTGFDVDEVEAAISRFMGWTLECQAVLFGVGNLGSALLNYPWRDEYGLHFIAAFEREPERSNILINNIPVFSIEYFPTFAREHAIDIGVVAVPAEEAQTVAEMLMHNDIRGIWNFSHTHLKISGKTTVENALFTQSLAVLTRRLVESRIQTADGDPGTGSR
jgi:redox-sensing transcriptional repressor